MKESEDEADSTEKIIKAARLALSQLAPIAPISLRGVVHALRNDINLARKNGLRWEEIAEILRCSGCNNVKAETVRTYHRVELSKRAEKVADAKRRQVELKRRNDEADRFQSALVAAPSSEQPTFENEVSNRRQGILQPVKSGRVK